MSAFCSKKAYPTVPVVQKHGCSLDLLSDCGPVSVGVSVPKKLSVLRVFITPLSLRVPQAAKVLQNQHQDGWWL